jgi:hypothetical protein
MCCTRKPYLTPGCAVRAQPRAPPPGTSPAPAIVSYLFLSCRGLEVFKEFLVAVWKSKFPKWSSDFWKPKLKAIQPRFPLSILLFQSRVFFRHTKYPTPMLGAPEERLSRCWPASRRKMRGRAVGVEIWSWFNSTLVLSSCGEGEGEPGAGIVTCWKSNIPPPPNTQHPIDFLMFLKLNKSVLWHTCSLLPNDVSDQASSIAGVMNHSFYWGTGTRCFTRRHDFLSSWDYVSSLSITIFHHGYATNISGIFSLNLALD